MATGQRYFSLMHRGSAIDKVLLSAFAGLVHSHEADLAQDCLLSGEISGGCCVLVHAILIMCL